MKRAKIRSLVISVSFVLPLRPHLPAQGAQDQLALGRKAIEARTGCYLVDYSFAETDALKPGYVRDSRVYDVNREKSIKEWIFAENISPRRICLQHVLFGVGLDGKLREGSVLKHTGEDWEYNAPFAYDYTGNSTWTVKSLQNTPGLWLRRVTNLDDGLRYQCAAAWKTSTAYPDWSCSGDAPVPGRETRDMHRKDYNLLERTSRLIVYDNNWLEREDNIKVVEENGAKAPLVREVGKTWYVRLPDVECSVAQSFAKPRLTFWTIEREAWDQVLDGQKTITEAPATKDSPSRYEQILSLEDDYLKKDLNDPKTAQAARGALLQVIREHLK